MSGLREEWRDLPGADILEEGLHDLEHGSETAPALLLRIAEPRLAAVGILLPRASDGASEHELTLYRLFRRELGRDAYGRYNASLRRLVSLCQALELRAARARRQAATSPAATRAPG